MGVGSYIFIQMEFHYQRCPLGTDCPLSRKMMLVAHFGLFGDGFEQVQTHCLAWVPVENIAWVMAMQALLTHMKISSCLWPQSTFLSTKLTDSGTAGFSEDEGMNGFVFSRHKLTQRQDDWSERGVRGLPVPHSRLPPTQLYSRKDRPRTE